MKSYWQHRRIEDLIAVDHSQCEPNVIQLCNNIFFYQSSIIFMSKFPAVVVRDGRAKKTIKN